MFHNTLENVSYLITSKIRPSTSTLNMMTMTTPSSLPFAEVTPPSITNMSVAPSPLNKNVESTVKKDPKPSNIKSPICRLQNLVYYALKTLCKSKKYFLLCWWTK